MTKREIPNPLYAAAGAGDLAYQRLRQLPDAASRTVRTATETAMTLRERVLAGDSRISRDRLAVDAARLRVSAQRGATTLATTAAVAQDRAVTGYRRLIAHGEQVLAARTGTAGEYTEPIEIAVGAAEAEPPQTRPTGQEGATETGPTTGDGSTGQARGAASASN